MSTTGIVINRKWSAIFLRTMLLLSEPVRQFYGQRLQISISCENIYLVSESANAVIPFTKQTSMAGIRSQSFQCIDDHLTYTMYISAVFIQIVPNANLPTFINQSSTNQLSTRSIICFKLDSPYHKKNKKLRHKQMQVYYKKIP